MNQLNFKVFDFFSLIFLANLICDFQEFTEHLCKVEDKL